MEILKLTLKKKWYDLIASGVKKEEYREIKPYWINRLCIKSSETINSYDIKKYDYVEFTNGYLKNSPKVVFEIKNITIREGKIEWGAEPDKDCFVIELGKKTFNGDK